MQPWRLVLSLGDLYCPRVTCLRVFEKSVRRFCGEVRRKLNRMEVLTNRSY